MLLMHVISLYWAHSSDFCEMYLEASAVSEIVYYEPLLNEVHWKCKCGCKSFVLGMFHFLRHAELMPTVRHFF
jgi:hypothetical protein